MKKIIAMGAAVALAASMFAAEVAGNLKLNGKLANFDGDNFTFKNLWFFWKIFAICIISSNIDYVYNRICHCRFYNLANISTILAFSLVFYWRMFRFHCRKYKSNPLGHFDKTGK